MRFAPAEVSVSAKEGRVPATWRFQNGVVVPMPTLPAFVTVNRVVVAKLATEESWKSGAVALLAPATSSVAKGVVVPRPTAPVVASAVRTGAARKLPGV